MTRRPAAIAAAPAVAVILAAAALLTACGSDGSTDDPAGSPAEGSTAGRDGAPGSGEAVGAIDGVTGELIVTRQRDLLDRGLINILTHNGSDHDLLLADRRLDADHFATSDSNPRPISIRAGRSVAVQVPYGTADDCGSERTVTARFAFSYTVDGGDTPLRASVDLGGTDILDRIRAEQCALEEFNGAAGTALTGVAVQPDGTLAADLVITPDDDAASTFTVGGTSGTILIAADTPGTLPLTVTAGRPVTVPIVFRVNRCDPHAMAEVTRRYGLDLSLTIDDGPPTRVPIDVSGIEADLEGIVDLCRQRTGGG